VGKGKKERLVPLLEEVRLKLLEYLSNCPYRGAHLPLFLGLRGKCLQATAAAKILRDFRRLYNLPETLTPHALRHTCASHLMASSKDLRGIQSLLGHASLNSTQIYTDLDMESLVATYQTAHPRQKMTST
jgi:integrase/recombinase XerC